MLPLPLNEKWGGGVTPPVPTTLMHSYHSHHLFIVLHHYSVFIPLSIIAMP